MTAWFDITPEVDTCQSRVKCRIHWDRSSGPEKQHSVQDQGVWGGKGGLSYFPVTRGNEGGADSWCKLKEPCNCSNLHLVVHGPNGLFCQAGINQMQQHPSSRRIICAKGWEKLVYKLLKQFCITGEFLYTVEFSHAEIHSVYGCFLLVGQCKTAPAGPRIWISL